MQGLCFLPTEIALVTTTTYIYIKVKGGELYERL